MLIITIPLLQVLEDRLPPVGLASVTSIDPATTQSKPSVSSNSLAVSRSLTTETNELSGNWARVRNDYSSIAHMLSSQFSSRISSQDEAMSSTLSERGPTSASLGNEKQLVNQSSSYYSGNLEGPQAFADSQHPGPEVSGSIAFSGFGGSLDAAKEDLKNLTYFVSQSSGSNTNQTQPSGFHSMSSRSAMDGGEGGEVGGGGGTSESDLHGHRMELNSVAFGGTQFTPVSKDLGSQAEYPSPQWLDAKDHDGKDDRTVLQATGTYPAPGTSGYPVSYASNSTMVATVSINVIYLPSDPLVGIEIENPPTPHGVFFQGTAIDISDFSPMFYYTPIVAYGDPLQTINDSVSTLTFSPNLVNYVHAWENMTIKWQMYVGPNAPAHESPLWTTFNTSRNDNFITLAKSTTDKLFLSLAYHGTVSAEGAKTVDETMNRMWQSSSTSAIANLQITRKQDGKPLFYYGNWSTGVTSLPDLLSDTNMTNGGGDGQCRSWAQFWNQELAMQGIPSQVKTIVPKGNDTGFLVRNWSFTHNYDINYNGADYESINGGENPFIVNNSYKFVNAPNKDSLGFTDGLGIAGQNSTNPSSLFVNHVLVKYMYTDNGVTHPIYYDPSYGKRYLSLLDFDVSALSGYYINFGDANTLFFARKNNVDKLIEEVRESP